MIQYNPDGISNIIERLESTDIYVGPTRTYTTLQDALDTLNNVRIPVGQTVNLILDEGTHTYTSQIIVNHPDSDKITIKGATSYTKTMTSVQSSSGSNGAWSVIINLNDVNNIAANDYCIIHTASGGTNPLYIAGCHQITNVDVANNRITVLVKAKTAAAPASTIIATVIVLKSIVNFSGSNGFLSISGRTTKFDTLAVIGTTTFYGFIATHCSTIFLSTVGIAEWSYGIYAYGNSLIRLYRGICAISGCDQIGAYSTDGGLIFWTSGYSTGNVFGYRTIFAGQISAGSSFGIGNTTGWSAGNNGYLYTAAYTASGNTTDFSPAVNTLGNENGYIDT